MKILFGVDVAKIFHVREFAKMLEKNGIECKLVIESEIYDGFPSRRISTWFSTAKKANNLFNEFKPDAVFVDKHGYFAKAVLDAKLPLLSHLRGDYWSEMKWHAETIGRGPIRRVGRAIKSKMEEKCFQDATMILPICNYLRDIVVRRYPRKESPTMYQGIDPDMWNPTHTSEFEFKLPKTNGSRPCVGLLQSASIWGKAQEMLILPKVLKELPHVMFYWAGDGPYRDRVLEPLSKYDNFKWLGPLDYPYKVREYLNSIDMYALISGIDMSPLTLLEAQLLQKPVLATSVGGVPELVQDGITAHLVASQDHKAIVSKINEMLSDEKRSVQMGKDARQFVSDNFNWDKIAQDFLKVVKPIIN